MRSTARGLKSASSSSLDYIERAKAMENGERSGADGGERAEASEKEREETSAG